MVNSFLLFLHYTSSWDILSMCTCKHHYQPFQSKMLNSFPFEKQSSSSLTLSSSQC
ncbi:hypothetical protein ACJW31_12G094600 [Castanea mollissima]